METSWKHVERHVEAMEVQFDRKWGKNIELNHPRLSSRQTEGFLLPGLGLEEIWPENLILDGRTLQLLASLPLASILKSLKKSTAQMPGCSINF